MSGVLSILRPNLLGARVQVSDESARLADMAIRPWDYELPPWIQTLDKGLQFLRSAEGRTLRRRLFALLVAIGGGTLVYRVLLSLRHRAARARERAEAEAKAKAAHQPPPVLSPSPDEEESIGDRLIHVPEEKSLIPVPSASAGEKTIVDKNAPPQKHRVAVDAIFFRRLGKILNIVIPTIYSTEMAYLVILTILLFARTFFSIYIAELIGMNAQSLVSRKWGRMWRGIKKFAVITIPASAVNAGLKYYTEMVSLRFRKKLSEYVHDQYLEGVNFYKACNLGGAERIDNADQRVTADIKDFSDEISALYASLLKPLLDVILFTYKLQTILGWQGPFAMHSYFLLSGLIKKNIMPNLGKLVARESELEGFYRTAHNRLITNSEEIAFYDGSKKEKVIINNALQLICAHIAYSRYIKALIGIFDGLLVKYYASIAGYATLLSPFIFMKPGANDASTADLTRDYIRNSQYLGQLSTAVGQLVIVGNKLTSIAGYTTRVSELLEQVAHLNDAGNVPFEIKPEIPHIIEPIEEGTAYTKFIQEWKSRCDEQQAIRFEIRHSKGSETSSHVVGGGDIQLGDHIIFQHVDIVSPEGKLLVHDLNFEVPQGTNVMVTGPNGVGKSSLFRIIGELWPLHSGVLIKPHKEEILFVPQKPYLVLGTLRDQIIYPHEYEDMQRLGVTDEDLGKLLAIVDPARNITQEWGWDTVKDWFHAFSGGQKQRVAMARLFYHRPRFAILDECTSAVSDEVEGTIYQTCRLLGITIFTVSHRPQLAKYHDKVLKFEGETRWSVRDIDSAAEIERERREKSMIAAGYQAALLRSNASSNSLVSAASSGSLTTLNARSSVANPTKIQIEEIKEQERDGTPISNGPTSNMNSSSIPTSTPSTSNVPTKSSNSSELDVGSIPSSTTTSSATTESIPDQNDDDLTPAETAASKQPNQPQPQQQKPNQKRKKHGKH